MAELSLDSEIQFVKGVGPRPAKAFQKAGFATAGDLLYQLPRRYEDRSQLPKIGQLYGGESVSVRGRLKRVESRPLRGGRVLIKAQLEDGTGVLSLVWFNQPWIQKKLSEAQGEIIAYGMVKMGSTGPEIAAPEFEIIEESESAGEFARIMPVYPLTDGLSQLQVRRAARSVVDQLADNASDPLPSSFRSQYKIPDLASCLKQIHLPDSLAEANRARNRLVFEEFLYLQISLAQRRNEVQQETGIAFPIKQLLSGEEIDLYELTHKKHTKPESENFIAEENLFADNVRKQMSADPLWDQIHKILPFSLTGAQKRVIEEIWDDMKLPHPMNRLVQGDVGSGKTAVAACAMLAAVRSGFQAAMMAPTEILAEQHYFNLKKLFEPIGLEVVLMAGKLTAKQRRLARESTANGVAKIVVGTQAIIAEGVEFRHLGLAVIDEQHRFGVMQRAALRDKSHVNPDVLVMTATPIPRTIAQTEFGDLDYSVIDELPPGRKPIKTHWRKAKDRLSVYEGVRKLLQEGRQAYFVCPLVSESELMMVQAAEELYKILSEKIYTDFKIALLHGKLTPSDKEQIMEAFRKGEFQVLVSTTVIEVGVDVPNATVMVIEDANRFGLAQLHQLRGRVGRGSHQSFCILVGDAGNGVAEERLEIMVKTTDGFEISEKDLELRGAGNIAGTEQSGFLAFRYGDIVKDAKLLSQARKIAFQLVEQNPELAGQEWSQVRERVGERRSMTALAAVS